MSIINATAPRESAGEIRAFPACQRDVCPASLPRVGPHPACDRCQPRPCASHGRLSLRRPTPPPRSRCHAAIPRESAAAAIVSIAASAIVSITVESTAVMAFVLVLFALVNLAVVVSFTVGVAPEPPPPRPLSGRAAPVRRLPRAQAGWGRPAVWAAAAMGRCRTGPLSRWAAAAWDVQSGRRAPRCGVLCAACVRFACVGCCARRMREDACGGCWAQDLLGCV